MATSSTASDLTASIDKAASHAINVRSGAGLESLLGAGLCRSDCDSQMILHLALQTPAKLSQLVLTAPAGEAPTQLKLFVNKAALSFDDVERGLKPAQEFANLDATSFDGTHPLVLKTTAFVGVTSLILFCDRPGADTCALSGIKLLGSNGGATGNLANLGKHEHEHD